MRTVANILPSAAPTGATPVRSLTLDSTAQVVSATPGNLIGISCINLHSAAIYLKFYNKAAAGVNPASDVPRFTLLVPATSQVILRGADLPWSFSTAISMRAVTNSGDTGTTAPGTLPIVELETLATA